MYQGGVMTSIYFFLFIRTCGKSQFLLGMFLTGHAIAFSWHAL
nr:MAG TPA: hypothetical protein [Bacteriophage sp.]